MAWLFSGFHFMYPLAAYLMGSILAAPLIARLYGQDIRSVGSGNPGFANSLRTLGLVRALPVLIWDTGKAVLVTLLCLRLQGDTAASWGALAVVCGHCYPLLHWHAGGKGVATYFGALLPVGPLAVLGGALVWIFLAKLSKISAVASLAGVFVTLVLWLPAQKIGQSGSQNTEGWLLTVALMAVVVWVRHRSNLQRLVAGIENKV